jgi:repressor LexA
MDDLPAPPGSSKPNPSPRRGPATATEAEAPLRNSTEPPSRPASGKGLTWRQCQIIQAIEEYTHDHGCSPSNRDIAQRAGLAGPSSVSHHLRKLRAAGWVSYDDACPRTVTVCQPGQQATRLAEPARRAAGGARPKADRQKDTRWEKVTWVPVAGEIAAGGPILAQESIDGYWPLPNELVGREEGLFILTVAGDSMTGAGIFDGDLVVIRPLFQPPRDGDIVAATIDGSEPEGTVKRYKKIGRQVWLMPHNDAHTPIPGGKAQFAGKVIAVLRQI